MARARRRAQSGVRLELLLMLTILALTLLAGSSEPGRPDLAQYEPNPAYPFGRRHPDAPVELEQFAFMIGECDCVDEIRGGDGTWTTTDAIWNAHWFLNGHGIQDVYWNDGFATTNLRLFDPERGRWFVNFLQAPTGSVGTGQWSGDEVAAEGGRQMVMWNGSPDGLNGSRLTFHDISNDGFRWKAESVVEGAVQGVSWKSTCVRRRADAAVRTPAFQGFEPGPAAPFGRRHPGAPAKTGELEFLVGEFETETNGADPIAPILGQRVTRHVLNGFALQQRSWTEAGATSTFFLVDPASGSWRAMRFRMPDYRWTVWDGSLDDGRWTGKLQLVDGQRPDAEHVWTFARSDFGYESTIGTQAGPASTRVDRIR